MTLRCCEDLPMHAYTFVDIEVLQEHLTECPLPMELLSLLPYPEPSKARYIVINGDLVSLSNGMLTTFCMTLYVELVILQGKWIGTVSDQLHLEIYKYRP